MSPEAADATRPGVDEAICPKCGAGNPKLIRYGLRRLAPGEPRISDPDIVYPGCIFRHENRACRKCGTRYWFEVAAESR